MGQIENDKANAAFAFDSVTKGYVAMFEAMDNDYMKERAADIKDVSKRVLSHILGVKMSDPSLINEEVIVVADDLTPSDTAQLSKEFVKGFITNIGGRTSHSAIMARSLEIPAIVGAKTVLQDTQEGQWVILDGLNGDIILSPDDSTVSAYQEKAKSIRSTKSGMGEIKR